MKSSRPTPGPHRDPRHSPIITGRREPHERARRALDALASCDLNLYIDRNTTFESHKGRMMESGGGASILEVRIRNGKRLSAFRSYTFPYMDRPNLTVLTAALVTRVTLEGKRATGVEIAYDGKIVRIGAGAEVVLSLGAIHTPKVLMQSGIGDASELQRWGIPTVHHLPGVGQNFQDHFGIGCVWEYRRPLAPRNNGGEATLFWKSNTALDTPDLQTCQVEVPLCSPETAARFNPPAVSWTLYGGVVLAIRLRFGLTQNARSCLAT
jgi:choline dehydrogenase